MDCPNAFGDDNLEELLRSQGCRSGDPNLRQFLLGQTRHVMRKRQRFRRLGILVGMAACYTAGLGTMFLLGASHTARGTGQVSHGKQDFGVQSIVQVPTTSEQAVAEVTATDLPASVLERLAEVVADDEFRDLYRRAGDRHMVETGDLAAALRCYRLALEEASPEELAITENDNWLIMTVKQARLKEQFHANNGG